MAASRVTNFSSAAKRLQQIRDDNLRVSKEVVGLWKDFISLNADKLGTEKWLALEQIFLASLDVGDYNVSTDTYELLNAQFKGSNRLQRLRAMYFESKDKYTEAEEIYKAILEQDPVDSATQKRMAALCKAQNKISEAVLALNKYLEINCMDFEAWMEMSELYLSQAEYEKAAFCVEELILNNPNNHLYHQRYAEIKYSMGDFDEARIYFTQAHKLSGNNVRALYGIVLCSQKLAAVKSKAKSDHIRIARKAMNELDKKLKEANSPIHSIHEAAMESLMDGIM